MTRFQGVGVLAAGIGLALLTGCGSDNTLVPPSNSISKQLGTGAASGIIPGSLPAGVLTAPGVGSSTIAGIQGGTVLLTVSTASPVTGVLVAEVGQNGYLSFSPTSVGTGAQTYDIQLLIPATAAVDQQMLQVETVGIGGVSKPVSVILNVGAKTAAP